MKVHYIFAFLALLVCCRISDSVIFDRLCLPETSVFDLGNSTVQLFGLYSVNLCIQNVEFCEFIHLFFVSILSDKLLVKLLSKLTKLTKGCMRLFFIPFEPFDVLSHCMHYAVLSPVLFQSRSSCQNSTPTQT